jgi:hypothetical protein
MTKIDARLSILERVNAYGWGWVGFRVEWGLASLCASYGGSLRGRFFEVFRSEFVFGKDRIFEKYM